MIKILTLLFFILFVLCLINNYSKEHLLKNTTNPQDLLKIHLPILGDSLFDSLVTYMNDDMWSNPSGKTGIEKCKMTCKGKCVEYGISGNAMCFLNDSCKI